MSDTRKITVTGGPSVFSVEGGAASSSKTRRRRSNAPATPSTILKVGGATTTATAPPTAVKEATEESQIKQIKVQEGQQELPPNQTPAPQNSKVILGGKKPKYMKVLLTKKNHDAPATAKPNRKVSLGLSHLKRRVTRARKVSRLSKTAPIEQIRKELITANIIKETSKAPEHILRQMYADAKVLTSKSL
jgi:hypothetical protein